MALSYVDRMLLPGEKVIARGGKHVLTYFHGCFFVFLALLLSYLKIYIEERYGMGKTVIKIGGSGLTTKNIIYLLYTFSIILFCYGVYSFFEVSTWSAYVITNRRFIRKYGIIKRVITEMELHNIIRLK